jgi:acyl carrier protein
MERNAIEIVVATFLNLECKAEEVGLDVDLFDSGIVDSFKMVELIVHLEKTTGTSIDLFDADPQSFLTIRGLTTLFESAPPDSIRIES